MSSISVLIVDDEPIARTILEGFVAMLPQLKLVGSCANAMQALTVLNTQTVDLLLLDIDMPHINGFSFLDSLAAPPKVIFTTAYHQYAIESYEHNALDYLLKPIRFERFLKAVNKLTPPPPSPQLNSADTIAVQSGLLFVKSEGKLMRIDLAEVQFIEGLKDYVSFQMRSGRLLVHSTMKSLEDRLNRVPAFLRIHKSYIVNLHFVQEVDGNCMRVGAESLTIGATYRDGVHAAMAQFRLL
jgi:DNA-binding LytR/AlgR family response regulator